MIEAVKNVLSNLRFGEPQSHETIVILPILGPAGAAFDYITLTDALESRLSDCRGRDRLGRLAGQGDRRVCRVWLRFSG